MYKTILSFFNNHDQLPEKKKKKKQSKKEANKTATKQQEERKNAFHFELETEEEEIYRARKALMAFNRYYTKKTLKKFEKERGKVDPKVNFDKKEILFD